MITQDQSEVVRFLSSPAAHGGAAVDCIETHASMVFLAGARAWKLKRAVKYDYLDFSTIDRRKSMCEAEVRVNRRMAPAVYLGTASVTRERDGSLAIEGAGEPVDWLVEMVRFDQDGLFDRLAERGALELRLMPPLAKAIAQFHRQADPRRDHGGVAGMTWVIEGNASGLAEQGSGFLDANACAALMHASRAHLEAQKQLLDSRRAAGMVRQCHGDLHLRNIVLLDGRPTLFDAIEFNDEIACIDVLYDLSFLLMDLWRRRLHRHANLVWNTYLEETTDVGGIALLPLFLSCRAAVRAKTSATAANLQSDAGLGLRATARQYLAMALEFLRPPSPRLMAIGGFSGSGKSTLARALAPQLGAAPGAVVIRSDEVRKRLCGVDPLQRLGPEGYTAQVSARVYATMADSAAQVLKQGHSAIVDAVYANSADRHAIERIASLAGIPFVGAWLEARESVLVERSESRRLDPSDADAAVIRQQLSQDTGAIAWRRLDASGLPDDVARAAAQGLEP